MTITLHAYIGNPKLNEAISFCTKNTPMATKGVYTRLSYKITYKGTPDVPLLCSQLKAVLVSQGFAVHTVEPEGKR